MQRYFVEGNQIADRVVTIIGDDVKHINRVMRMNEGDELIINDNNARTVLAVITSQTEEQVQAEIVEELNPNTELPVQVTIAQGLPKGDKLELIVQKGTELGAFAFLPYAASRSIVKWDKKKAEKKIDRLAKIAKEAAEQSYRERIPTIYDVHSLHQLVQKLPEFDLVIVAYEESAKKGEQAQLAKSLNSVSPGSKILIIIGPEGGLESDEVDRFLEAKAVVCGFGPRILRTETAALYALAAISYHFELMR